MKFKKIVLSLLLCLSSNISYAQDNNDLNEKTVLEPKKCKHNALHFATSIEDINYIKDLLKLEVFTLIDYNKQCQTVLNIASELGNIEILNLFSEYLDNLNIYNGLGEDLLQNSLRLNQPESLLFFINKGLNPHLKNAMGKSAYDYQKLYGNELTKKILDEYDNNLKRIEIKNSIKDKDSNLQKLKKLISEKELELSKLFESQKDNPELLKQIKSLYSEIESLKLHIKELENIISSQNEKIKSFEKSDDIKKEASEAKTIKSNLETHIPENKISKDVVLDEISSDGEILESSAKMFEILTKPIYKIKK